MWIRLTDNIESQFNRIIKTTNQIIFFNKTENVYSLHYNETEQEEKIHNDFNLLASKLVN